MAATQLKVRMSAWRIRVSVAIISAACYVLPRSAMERLVKRLTDWSASGLQVVKD